MIASLPPLPEPPPWRSGKAQVERIAVRILGGICVIAALAGTAFNIWLMLREKPSFSNIGNALFFASWLLITSQYLKRHY